MIFCSSAFDGMAKASFSGRDGGRSSRTSGNCSADPPNGTAARTSGSAFHGEPNRNLKSKVFNEVL
jgi:hypothetical protein